MNTPIQKNIAGGGVLNNTIHTPVNEQKLDTQKKVSELILGEELKKHLHNIIYKNIGTPGTKPLVLMISQDELSLHILESLNHTNIEQLLPDILQYDAHFLLSTQNASTVGELALSSNNIELVKDIILSTCFPSAVFDIFLNNAIESDNDEIAKMILEKPFFNVNTKNFFEKAIDKNALKIIALMLQNPELEVQNGFLKALKGGNKDLCEKLLSFKTFHNTQALGAIIEAKEKDILKKVIENGKLQTSLQDLKIAFESRDLEIIKIVLHHIPNTQEIELSKLPYRIYEEESNNTTQKLGIENIINELIKLPNFDVNTNFITLLATAKDFLHSHVGQSLCEKIDIQYFIEKCQKELQDIGNNLEIEGADKDRKSIFFGNVLEKSGIISIFKINFTQKNIENLKILLTALPSYIFDSRQLLYDAHKKVINAGHFAWAIKRNNEEMHIHENTPKNNEFYIKFLQLLASFKEVDKHSLMEHYLLDIKDVASAKEYFSTFTGEQKLGFKDFVNSIQKPELKQAFVKQSKEMLGYEIIQEPIIAKAQTMAEENGNNSPPTDA